MEVTKTERETQALLRNMLSFLEGIQGAHRASTRGLLQNVYATQPEVTRVDELAEKVSTAIVEDEKRALRELNERVTA